MGLSASNAGGKTTSVSCRAPGCDHLVTHAPKKVWLNIIIGHTGASDIQQARVEKIFVFEMYCCMSPLIIFVINSGAPVQPLSLEPWTISKMGSVCLVSIKLESAEG